MEFKILGVCNHNQRVGFVVVSVDRKNLDIDIGRAADRHRSIEVVNEICKNSSDKYLVSRTRKPGQMPFRLVFMTVAGSILRYVKTFFRTDWSWTHFYDHFRPTADSSRAVVSYWQKDVLVNRLGLSLPRKSVVRKTYRLVMTTVVEWDVKPSNEQTNRPM